MNFIKFGIVSAAAGCLVVVACGGSSSDNSSSTGGTTSSGGTSSTAGSTSKGGNTTTGTAGSTSKGGSTGTGTGGTSTGTGGICNSSTDPMNMTQSDCPAATACIESKCKAQFDACSSATGACADTIKCEAACNCDADCISTCSDKASAACTQCTTGVLNCALSNCLNESLSCAGTGGNGSGGTFGTGGTGFDFDAGTYTCMDLAACCKKLSGSEQTDCNSVVTEGLDFACSIAYSGFCPSN